MWLHDLGRWTVHRSAVSVRKGIAMLDISRCRRSANCGSRKARRALDQASWPVCEILERRMLMSAPTVTIDSVRGFLTFDGHLDTASERIAVTGSTHSYQFTNNGTNVGAAFDPSV